MNELFDEAKKFLEEGKTREAVVIYEHIVKKIPDYHEARHDLARLLLDCDETDAALIVLEEGLERDKNVTSFFFLKGIIYLKTKNFSESLKSFRAVEKLEGLSPALVLNMGLLHRELGAVSVGLELLESWIEKSGGEPQVYCLIAELNMEVQEWDKAQIAVEQGLKLDADSLHLLYVKGALYSRKKKWLEAIPIFKSLLEKMPKNTIIMHELGWAYIQVSHLEGGIELLEKCYLAEPAKISILTDLAVAYSQVPDFEKSMDYAKKAEVLDPYDSTTHDLIKEIQIAKAQMGQ